MTITRDNHPVVSDLDDNLSRRTSTAVEPAGTLSDRQFRMQQTAPSALGKRRSKFLDDHMSHGSPEDMNFQSPDIQSRELFFFESSSEVQVLKDQTAATAIAALAQELERLTIMTKKDPAKYEKFRKEMQDFCHLFTCYLATKVKGDRLDWNKIQSPNPEQIQYYHALPKCPEDQEKSILSRLAVLKLNGGLGTTMGCVGPKSVIEVRDGLSFLDLTVRQIEHKNSEFDTNIPLILMNSFNTDDETKSIIKKYQGNKIDIITFNQSRFPRISKDSLVPLAKDPEGHKYQWYPPGHGDVFASLSNSGVLDSLLASGKEYLFLSNVDNLGATVDTAILKHMIDTGAEFIMEVTDKTKADIKGGTLINYDGQVRLLEIAQVPPEHVEDFKSIKKFKIFNTNNLWLDLKAVKRVVENRELDLEVIVNLKTEEKSGEKVIQLETAVGAAIKHFRGAHGVNVPRARFLPVKSCSDLFLVQSDLYQLNKGQLVMNSARQFGGVPIVKLGDHFKKVQNFLQRFKNTPHILELDHLTVAGDVYFGSDVVLKGTVIIVANPPSRIDIPSGAVLEDKVITGDLRILDH